MLTAILKSVRPHQWVKNLFVAAPVVFARRAGDPQAILHAAAAFASFCFLSSAVYQLNDLVDIEKDRAHPLKRRARSPRVRCRCPRPGPSRAG